MGAPQESIIEQLASLDAAITRVKFARSYTPAKPTVMVRVDEVRPYSATPNASRDYKCALILLVPGTVTDSDTDGGVEDQLGELLEDVLLVLDGPATNLTWDVARRGVFDETQPCYEIDMTVPIQIGATP